MASLGVTSGLPLIVGETLFDCFPDKVVLGGAALNVAWNLKGLGSDPVLLSRVGQDEAAEQLLAALRRQGLRLEGLQRDPLHPTGQVRVTLDGEGIPTFAILPDQAYDYIQLDRAALQALRPSLIYRGSLAARREAAHRHFQETLPTGALGGFYGAKLQQAGFTVHFLLHSDYDHVRQKGLWVESCWGDFHLPQVNAYAAVEEMPVCEGVIVALKATQNHLLPRLLPPVLADNGVVILLQNGLGAEPEIANWVGPERVIGGLCFISSNKVGPGHICHLDYGSVLLAEYGPGYAPQGITPRLQQVQADFQRAGIPTSLSPDLMLARWQKLVWNIPFNGLSVIFNADTQQMIRDPEARALAETLMHEVIQGAAACGRHLPQTLISEMLASTEKMAPYRTSMKIDYERKRPLELEAIFANPLRYAQQGGIQMPRVEMLYRQLQVLDRLNRGIPA